MPFVFDNSYARLPERFYARVLPTPVRAPKVVKVNHALARSLGVDPTELEGEDGAAILSGNAGPEGAEPIAMAYAGHQFGGFVPQLGDGRAILLGEVIDAEGRRRDVQLKGAGRTPFSRGGDGRAALGPVLREYIVSEAMAALGVPTTRSLAAVTTGEPVYREEALPGAVLTRVASSHLRVGTFEYFAARRDREAIELLTHYALERHYPAAARGESDALALLDGVIDAQARLIAQWLGLGFIHGVMNTDNSTISGETIDYGPCAFLDEYDPHKTFSSIDRRGRYAYDNQPTMAQWNLARLAEALLPLIDPDQERAVAIAVEHLRTFSAIFEEHHTRGWRAKLGLGTEQPGDLALADDLLERMAASEVDFTMLFRKLAGSAEGPEHDARVAALFAQPGAFYDWAERWRRRLAREQTSPEDRARAMRQANPAFIPRNHRVEEAIAAATHRQDLQPFEDLVRVLQRPYDDQPEAAHLAEPPLPEERVQKTFCGT